VTFIVPPWRDKRQGAIRAQEMCPACIHGSTAMLQRLIEMTAAEAIAGAAVVSL